MVEDDEPMLRAVSAGLAARGYRVDTASNGRRAIDAASAGAPDVVLLDLGLPDIDGIDVCRHLRRWTQNPIIVLSADGAEDRKIAALDQGADDYVTKPFSMPELLARVRAALRHRAVLGAVLEGPAIEIGALRIDIAGHVATVDGAPLELTKAQFDILATLARHCGKVLTFSRLLAGAGGHDGDDVAQGPPVLRNHVYHLRRKLGEGPRTPAIVTEARIGYRMVAPGGDLDLS